MPDRKFLTTVKPSLFAGWLLFWLLMIVVAVQDHLRSGGKHIWEPVFWESTSALVSTVIVYFRRHALTDPVLLNTPRRWFLQQILCLPVIGLVFVLAIYAVRHAVYSLLGMSYRHETWDQVFIYEISKICLFFGIFYVVIFGVQAYASLLEEKENAEKSQTLLRQAQLHRLTQQMQPHFLFNVLNMISSLMYSDVKKADSALSQIAELLRASLDLGQQSETELRHELELLDAYAKLMCLRFIDRVEITWDIAVDVLGSRVPVMSLQTILENTFKHTVERRSEMTRITISVRSEQGQVVVCVQDNVGQLNPVAQAGAGQGIGLRNLRERLQVLYQGRASLQLSALTPTGVMTELRVPL